ncbi:MAG: 50S ribosomal protein L14e [Candidatus Bathyarchaeia archaeon]
MCAMVVGRICVKTQGRDSGRKCVIVSVIDDSHVLITGPKNLTGVRRRKVNVLHLRPLDRVIRLRRNASDDVVTSTLARNKLEDFMRSRD